MKRWNYRGFVQGRGQMALGVLGAALWCAGSCAQPSDLALPVSAAGPAPVSLDNPAPGADAAAIYRRMTSFVADQPTFFVELASTTTISGAGAAAASDKQTGGLSRVWFRRPGHVVWTTQSDIGSSAMAIDGRECTLFLPALSRYMVSPVSAGADTDSQVAAMSAPYGMITTSLFSSTPQAALEGLLTGPPERQADEFVLGVQCHHLKLPTSSGMADIWIAQGPIPMPVKTRMTMTIPAAPGENNAIESRTEVSFRWRINVELPDSTFKLKLPETAVRSDKLGSPIKIASIPPKPPAQETKPSSSKKTSSKISSSKPKPDSSKREFDLAFEPPPNLSASGGGYAYAANSDSTDDIVRAAIQGSRPDSVPSGASYQPSRDNVAPPPPASAAKTPGVKLQLMNGQTIDLASYRGRKAVVLDFWASWCGPCRQSMPVVSQVAQAYRSHGVEFFAVNMAEGHSEIQSFIQQQQLSLPVALDPHGQVAAAFGVSGIPHLVVIGKDGTVKGTHTGADASLQQNLIRDLDTALR